MRHDGSVAFSEDQISRHRVDSVLSHLRSVVGAAHVLDDASAMASYCHDWTRRYGGPAICVVRPASLDELSKVVKVCSDANMPMLPQGGNTGLVGGSVPSADGPSPVLISTRRLSWMGDVDEASGQVSVGAGAVLGDVQRHVRAAGWEYGVDLAARDSATIGGTVATNAGGVRVLTFGMTRMQVAGIEAVLADGAVISHMSGLAKDNTGLDLGQLLSGSEGTLAIITSVRLRLHRPFGPTSIALIGCSGYDDALDVTRTGVRGRLVAAEVLDETCMRLASEVGGLPNPLMGEHAIVLLLEVADGGAGDGFVRSVVEERDAVVGLDESERRRLWEYRERQGEFFDTRGIVHKLDVSVPLVRMEECVHELRSLISTVDSVQEFGIFGHVADGNIHVEIVGPEADDADVDHAVLRCIARHGGAISAEHGVGRAKVSDLTLSRSDEEISAMRAIKSAWDPRCLVNPGVLFDATA